MRDERRVVDRLVTRINEWLWLAFPCALLTLAAFLLWNLVGIAGKIEGAVDQNNKKMSACVESGGDPVMADFGLKYIGCRRAK